MYTEADIQRCLKPVGIFKSRSNMNEFKSLNTRTSMRVPNWLELLYWTSLEELYTVSQISSHL